MNLVARLKRIAPIEWLLIAIQIAFVLATRLGQPAIDVDDAYTHFHIAQNWSEGHGFVFNDGVRLLGTTSPVYVTALAGLHRVVGGPLPLLARNMNMVADIVIVLIAIAWFARAGMPLLMRHAAGLILTAEPLRMHYSLAGMEMSFFIVFMMILFAFALGGRWILAGAMVGLVGWVRPEGAIVWLAVACGLWVGGRRREIPRLYAVAIAVASATAGVMLAYFGTFIPQSVVAKGSADWYTQAGFSAPMFLIRLGDLTPFYVIHGTVSSWGTIGDKINSLIIALAQLSLMAAGAAWIWQKGLRQLSVMLAVFVAGWFMFYALTNPMIIDWYYVPYFFGSLLLATAGWQAVGEAVYRRFRASLVAWRKLAYPAALACLLAAYWFSLSQQIDRAGRSCDTMGERLAFRFRKAGTSDREVEYVKIADMIRGWNKGPAPLVVGCTEIGIFGYYYRGPLLDFFGLISPEVLDVLEPEVRDKLPAGCRVFPYAAIMHFKPDLVMTHPMFIPPEPAEFTALYQRLHVDYQVGVWVRRDMIPRLPLTPKMLREGHFGPTMHKDVL